MDINFKKSWQTQSVVIFFLILTIWWLINNFIIGNVNIKYDGFGDFAEIYGLIAILGSVWGIVIGQKWGGLKSLMGRALIIFSIGLLAQEFGQIAYALYNDIYKVPGPYPSIGDLGFFGSIPLYIYGTILLGKASGINISLRNFQARLQAVVIPLVLLVISYFFFLKGYEFDWSNPIKIFLDFGYPFGQAIYIALALLTYLLSRNLLGGMMKSKVLFILFALFLQYVSDFTFLYQSSRGTWSVGGINDYMYLVAYFVMTLGLLQFNTALTTLRQEQK